MLNKPLIIAVLGIDGAGKSTLIGNLEVFFKSHNISTRTYHFSPSFIRNKKNDIPVLDPYKRKQRSSFVSFLKLIYIVLRYNFFMYFYYYIFLKDVPVLIFDRYFYDISVDKIRYRIKLKKMIIFKFFEFIPKPDLILFINTSIQNCNERSNDQINDNFRLKFNDSYSNLKNCFKNFYEINGNQTKKAIFNDVKDLLKTQQIFN